MHTVLLDACIGCRLCVDPCPVDCIDIVPLVSLLPADAIIDKPARAQKAKQRYQARQLRLQQEVQRQLPVYASKEERVQQIRQDIQDAITRVRKKRDH